MCGCCRNDSKRPFKECRQAILNGVLFLQGTCTNCFGKGAEASCSMTQVSKKYGARKPPPPPKSDDDDDDDNSPAPRTFKLPSRAARPTGPLTDASPPKAVRYLNKDSIAWSELQPQESRDDHDYEPKKRFQKLDLGDLSAGRSLKDKREMIARLQQAIEDVQNAPTVSPTARKKRSKSASTSSPTKRKAPAKKASPKKPAAPKTPTKKGAADKRSAPATPTTRSLRANTKRLPPDVFAEDEEDDESDSYAAAESDDESEFESPSKRKRRH